MNALDIVRSLVVLIGATFIAYNMFHFRPYFTWFFKQSLGFEIINSFWLLGLGSLALFGVLGVFVDGSKGNFVGLILFIVSTGFLQATLGTYRRNFEKEQRLLEKSKKEKLLREEQRTKQEIEDREVADFQNVLNSLGIIEKVTIAKNTVVNFPLGEYEQIVDHLTNENQKCQVLSELNEKIRTEYENHLLSMIGSSYKSSLYQKLLDGFVNEIMKMGREMLFNKFGLQNPEVENTVRVSREISKVKKWSEIKDEL